MKNSTDIAYLRNTLLANGYTPLPLKVDTKQCLIRGWSKDTVTADWLVEKTKGKQRQYASTGLRCDRLAAFDLDIYDEDLCDDAEALVEELCGPTELCRVGSPPKRLLLYRMTGGTPPYRSSRTGKYGEHQAELLTGPGRQFVCEGVHPTAGRYEWSQTDPFNTALADLPAVDWDTAQDCMTALDAMLADTGIPLTRPGAEFGSNADVYDLTDDYEIQVDGGITTWAELRDTLDETGVMGNIKREHGEFGDSNAVHFYKAYGSGEPVAFDFTRDQTHREAMQAMPTIPGAPIAPPLTNQNVADMIETWALLGDGTARMIDKPDVSLQLTGLQALTADKMAAPTTAAGRPTAAFMAWKKHPDTLRAHVAALRPDHPGKRIVPSDKLRIFNTYIAPQHPPGGDTAVAHEFIAHLIPDPIERAQFYDWHAIKVQNPGYRMHALLMVTQESGTGRGTWFQIVEKMLTPAYVQPLELSDLIGSGSQSAFNEYLATSLVICVPEVLEATENQGYQTARRIGYERFKAICETVPSAFYIKRKYGRNSMELVFASMLMASNHIDAFAIDPKDRRLIVLENTDTPLHAAPRDLFDRVQDWHTHPANIGALYRELAARPVEYNPFGPPLETAAKERMISEGQMPVDKAMDWIVENAKGDLITAYQFEQLAKRAEADFEFVMPDKPAGQIRHVLQKRAKPLLPDSGKLRIDKSTTVRPWVVRNFKKWHDSPDPKSSKVEVLKNGTPGGSLHYVKH